jgi:effector-binding domain-containing protein
MTSGNSVQKLLYGISSFIVLLIIVGLALPRHSRVEVTTSIDAHPPIVFALINDFHRVGLWSPWLDTDPNARVVYSGPVRGVGAIMTWDGAIIGTGTQVIKESRPFEFVETAVNPGESSEHRSWFDLEGQNGTTTVTWGYEADQGYNVFARYFSLLFSGVVQRDYELGLGRLKELAETLPNADFGDIEIEQIVVAAMDIAFLSTTSVPEPSAMSEAMGDAYFEILSFIDEQGLQEAGAPLSITRSFSGSELLFDAGIPVRGVNESTPRSGAPVKIGQTYAGTVIRVRHIGPYRTLGQTHSKIAAYLAALDIERAGDAWESYVSDPTKVPEAELLTYIYYPISL